MSKNEKPYIIKKTVKKIVSVEALYNPKYGDHRICTCGHEYHRHFDSFEDNRNVGCKYCGCYSFVEDIDND